MKITKNIGQQEGRPHCLAPLASPPVPVSTVPTMTHLPWPAGLRICVCILGTKFRTPSEKEDEKKAVFRHSLGGIKALLVPCLTPWVGGSTLPAQTRTQPVLRAWEYKSPGEILIAETICFQTPLYRSHIDAVPLSMWLCHCSVQLRYLLSPGLCRSLPSRCCLLLAQALLTKESN